MNCNVGSCGGGRSRGWPYRPKLVSQAYTDINNAIQYQESKTLFAHWDRNNSFRDHGGIVLSIDAKYGMIQVPEYFKKELVPENIRGVVVYFRYSRQELPSLPTFITHLEIISPDTNIVSAIPSHITHLRLVGNCTLATTIDIKHIQSVTVEGNHLFLNIPRGLVTCTYLKIEPSHLCRYDMEADYHGFPPTVTRFSSKFGMLQTLPSTIKHLEINKKVLEFEDVPTDRLETLSFPMEFPVQIPAEIASSPLMNGVYRIGDHNINDPIPAHTLHLIWNTTAPIPAIKNDNIKTMSFGKMYNRFIAPDTLPQSVKEIHFLGLNQCLGNVVLPNRLESLFLGPNFYQQLYGNHHLPLSLQWLEISIGCDKYSNAWIFTIGSLPRSVTHLKLSFNMNRKLDSHIYLPSTVLYVDIDKDFNDFICIIPEQEYYACIQAPANENNSTNLKELRMSPSFNQVIKQGVLPDSLQTLEITGYGQSWPTTNIIPKNIKRMKLDFNLLDFIPIHGIEYLEYNIPPYIQKMVIDQTSSGGELLYKDNIPKEFDPITGNFDKWDSNIRITQLIFTSFSGTIVESSGGDGHLYKSIYLNEITIKSFKTTIPINYLPQNLIQLVIEDYHTTLSPNSLPASLKVLQVYSCSNLSPALVIPPSVEHLSIMNEQVPPSILVQTIKRLDVNLESNIPFITKPVEVVKIEKQYTPYNKATGDIFLYLWRIGFVKNKILGHNYRSIFSCQDAGEIPSHLLSNLTVKYFDKMDKKDLQSNYIEGLDMVEKHTKTIEIPKNVKRLRWSHSKNPVPLHITHLDLWTSLYYQSYEFNNFRDIKKSYIPPSVTYLNLLDVQKIYSDTIPDTVKHLVLKNVNFMACFIPPSVTTIEFSGIVALSSVSRSKIPDTVKTLKFPTESFQGINGEVHPSILAKCSINDSKSRLNRTTSIQIYSSYGPISPETTTLVWLENKIIEAGIIPNHVRRIIFGNQFNQMIQPNSIPATITELNFGKNFNQNLTKIYMPPSLKYLSFGKAFAQNIPKDVLPPATTHLYFKQIKSQTFSIFQALEHIPPTVSHLQIEDFIDGRIPNTIKHLKIGKSYEKLPSSLLSVQASDYKVYFYSQDSARRSMPEKERVVPPTYPSDIQIGLVSQSFNKFLVPKSLLTNIVSIDFGACFNQFILPGTLPQSLKELNLGESFNNQLAVGSIPTSVEKLIISYPNSQPLLPNIIPSFVKSLVFINSCYDLQLLVGSIPESVEELVLSKSFKKYIQIVPNNVRILTIPFFDNKSFTCNVPSSVQELFIENGTNNSQAFSCDLVPPSVTKLYLAIDLPTINIEKLPSNVKILQTSDRLSRGGTIPNTVEYIHLHPSFNSPLETILPMK